VTSFFLRSHSNRITIAVGLSGLHSFNRRPA
jgi:hypothetical protein